MRKTWIILFITISILLLTACGEKGAVGEPMQEQANTQVESDTAPVPTEPASPTTPPEIPPTATVEPGPPDTPEPTATATVPPPPAGPPANSLPPEPIELTIESQSGAVLPARYYPAAYMDAPVVLLIHWVNSDQADWYAIAPWLQNRGVVGGGECSLPIPCPWLDPTWFPAIPPEHSYAVLTVSLSGCTANGCNSWAPANWTLDVNAAILKAVELENVDPNRIITVGASIGADGAIDSCAYLNEQADAAGRCAGAFSLSPGSYLSRNYPQTAAQLSNLVPAVAAWCLAADGDNESAPMCAQAQGTAVRSLPYEGNHHGMMLIQPGLKPKDLDQGTLELLVEFLAAASTP